MTMTGTAAARPTCVDTACSERPTGETAPLSAPYPGSSPLTRMPTGRPVTLPTIGPPVILLQGPG